MKNKILLPIVIGIGIVLILLGVTSSQPTGEPILREPTEYTKLNLSYVDSNSVLKSSLTSNGILMSSPLKFKGDSIAQYCTFYQDEQKQNSITYCTSTELKDSEGKFLGNIHMVGSMDSPNAVLGVVQTDPNLSNLDSLKTTFQIMVDSIVCDCWEDQMPGDFATVSEWIDAAKSYHLEAKKTTSSSEISGLADKHLFLEITTNSDGYLWKLIISN